MKGLGLTRRNEGITRFDPWKEAMDFSRTVDNLIHRGFQYTPIDRLFDSSKLQTWTPNISLYETQEAVVFTADLPGFTQEEINLNVTPEKIELSARHQEEMKQEALAPKNAEGQESAEWQKVSSEAQGEQNGESNNSAAPQPTEAAQSNSQERRIYYVQGQQRRSFSLSYRLPSEIEPEKVQASYKNGVLEVWMPKAQPVQPRQIRIEVISEGNEAPMSALSTGETDKVSPDAEEGEKVTRQRASRKKS